MVDSAWGDVDVDALTDSKRADSEITRILGLGGDPLANIDALLSLIAADLVDPSIACGYVAGVASRLFEDVPVAVELYSMSAEFGDLHDFVPEDSDSERAVLAAMREAAKDWGELGDHESGARRAYFDRWSEKRDPMAWRTLLGGPTFDALDASGWFRWDDRDPDERPRP